MKKILIVMLVVGLSTSVSYSQTASGAGYGEAKNASPTGTVKEATINGIPYSQYKAQQDALKQTSASQQAATTTNANDPFASTSRPASTQAAKNNNEPKGQEVNASKTAPQSHKLVSTDQNAAVTAPVNKTKSDAKNAEGGGVMPVDASKTKVEPVKKTEVVASGAVPPTPADASRGTSGNNNGATQKTEVKPVEPKAEATQPSANSSGASRTKTD